MKDRNIRLTQPALKVLRFLIANPRLARSGAEISKATKVTAGTLYPMLARMEDGGWLTSKWEEIDPSKVGRPRRRFYSLTAVGQNSAQGALQELQMATGEFAWTS